MKVSSNLAVTIYTIQTASKTGY